MLSANFSIWKVEKHQLKKKILYGCEFCARWEATKSSQKAAGLVKSLMALTYFFLHFINQEHCQKDRLSNDLKSIELFVSLFFYVR